MSRTNLFHLNKKNLWKNRRGVAAAAANQKKSIAMSKSSSQEIITCKAAVIWGAGQPLKVEEIEIEAPKSCEVRVKMLYASVCHTDISRAQGRTFPLFPRVLGHEGVGVVESVGDQVKDLKEGDFVMPTFIGECQDCENCKSRKTNICLKHTVSRTGLMADGTSRMSINGQKLYHLFSCSTWSEYTVVDSNFVVKIDPNIHFPHVSSISCGYSTGFGAAWKEAKVKNGSSVAVFGLGGVGLGGIEGARMMGASKIIGIDKNGMKKDKGQCFGMTDFIKPDELGKKSISEVVKELTGGKGVDCCLECTGVPSLMNEAIEATKVGTGKVIMIGGGVQVSFTVDYFPILTGRTLKGCIFGGLKIKSDLPLILEKCKNKELHLDELVTHEITLDNIGNAFEILKQPDCVKLLIKIS